MEKYVGPNKEILIRTDTCTISPTKQIACDTRVRRVLATRVMDQNLDSKMEGWIVDGVKCIGYQIGAVAMTDLIVNWQHWSRRGISSRHPIICTRRRRKTQVARCTMRDTDDCICNCEMQLDKREYGEKI